MKKTAIICNNFEQILTLIRKYYPRDVGRLYKKLIIGYPIAVNLDYIAKKHWTYDSPEYYKSIGFKVIGYKDFIKNISLYHAKRMGRVCYW